MRRLFIGLSLVIVLAFPGLVRAQGNIHLSALSVDIWPEYDQSSVLVIYHISLAQGTSLPATLALKIPVTAQINAVAVVDPAKGLLNTPYERAAQGAWAMLTFSTNSLESQFEYYDPLEKQDQARHITFEWRGDYAVDTFAVNFLRPRDAENLVMVPAADMTGFGQEGLANYLIQASDFSAGQSFLVTIEYSRKSDDLGISNLPILAVSTPGADTPGHISMIGALPWILGAVGVLLIAVGLGGFIMWQRGGRAPAQIHAVQKREKKRAEGVFCQECGERAQPGDHYCRACGTRFRNDAAS